MNLPSAHDALDVDHTGTLDVLAPKLAASRGRKRAAVGMWGYLVAGVLLGLALIALVTYARRMSAGGPATVGAVIDNVTHLDGAKLDPRCFAGMRADASERFTVSLEVGIDGRVRYANATGGQARLRSCVVAHVKGWEFLPQAEPQTMVLPFEVSRR